MSYSWVSPPRTCFPVDRVLGEVDLFGWPGGGLGRGERSTGAT